MGIPFIEDVNGDGIYDLLTFTGSSATTTVNGQIYSNFYNLTITPGALK